MPKKKANYKKVSVPIKSGEIIVYATPRVSDALIEVTEDMNFYKGVRLLEVIEAVYTQGKKDGAETAFNEVQERLQEAKDNIPHGKPGRPQK